MDGRFDFWRRYLLLVTTAVIAFGLTMVLVPGIPERLFSWMFFGESVYPFGPAAAAPLVADPVQAVDYVRFMTGVLGAVMVAWGVLIAAMLVGPLRRRESWAWRSLAWSLAIWCLTDTAWSVWQGYWQNGALNLVVLGVFLPGLAGTRPSRGLRP